MRFVRVGAALLGAAAAVLGFISGSGAAAADQTGDVGPAIIDGGFAENAPWAARLFVNGQENCSATIIAPEWILTAQHCVAGGGTYTFHIGSLDQTQGESATGIDIQTHPSADLALVRLDHAVSATYSPLGTADAVCANRIDGITAGGDSGGPMFATSQVDGGYYQVGVASTSDRQTFTAYTNVTRYRDWIAGIAGV